MKYIDTHAHLDSEEFAPDSIREIVTTAEKEGVSIIICPATDASSTRKVREISEQFPGIYFAGGIHCHSADNFIEKDFVIIKRLLKDPKAVAVGEIGLDFHYNFSSRALQDHVLKRFLKLALDTAKPVILHCREAEPELYEHLLSYKGKLGGVIHCYTGNREWALRFVELGYYMGFTGIITFKKSQGIREVVSALPIDRILSETDSPYMTPVPYRGKRNNPGLIPIIVQEIARIKNMDEEKTASILIQNALDCFNINKIQTQGG